MDVKVTANFTPNEAFFAKHEKAVIQALEMTGEALLGDLRLSQTMPFRTGDLQNNLTFVDHSEASKGKVSIKHQGPYARRLYYNPQFNFSKLINPHAGGRWLDPYLSGGAKSHYAKQFFRQFYKQRMGL